MSERQLGDGWLYVIKVVRRTKRGPLWRRYYTFDSTKVGQALDVRAACDYAIDYPMWSNESVVVEAVGGGVSRTVFSKQGSALAKDAA
jgi:hypothetical protein